MKSLSSSWDAMAVVGRIARAHGRRGEVIINPETDFAAERFRPGRTVHMRRAGEPAAVGIVASRFHRGRPIVRFEGIDSMTAAEELAGLELRVPLGELHRLPEGLYYHHDLVGCEVVTVEDVPVGRVASVEGPVSGSRLVVTGGTGEVLIPLARDICVEIDVERRRIVITPPEGLLDLNQPVPKRGR